MIIESSLQSEDPSVENIEASVSEKEEGDDTLHATFDTTVENENSENNAQISSYVSESEDSGK